MIFNSDISITKSEDSGFAKCEEIPDIESKCQKDTYQLFKKFDNSYEYGRELRFDSHCDNKCNISFVCDSIRSFHSIVKGFDKFIIS